MQFIVKAYDGKGMFDKRMEVRPRHLEGMARLAGHVICAGGLLDESGKMIGSALIMEFADRKELDDYLANEPYVQEHIWEKIDVDRMNVVIPHRGQTDFRPMRRSKQALPEEECFSILANAYRGFLSVVGDGGYPYSVPINFVFEDGKLFFHCAREGHKLDALRACDKACFTVLGEPEKEPGDWWFHVKSVICFGRVRSVSDESERHARLRSLAQKYFPEGYDIEADITRNGPRAEILEFTIEHLTGKAVREK